MRLMWFSLLVVSLTAVAADAGAPITGYGDVHFGDSLQAVKKAFPGGKLLSNGTWACDIETPYLSDARSFFSVTGGRLEHVLVFGKLASDELGSALVRKYGLADSARMEGPPSTGQILVTIWIDSSGNRLQLKIDKILSIVGLDYSSAEWIRRTELEAQTAVQKKL